MSDRQLWTAVPLAIIGIGGAAIASALGIAPLALGFGALAIGVGTWALVTLGIEDYTLLSLTLFLIAGVAIGLFWLASVLF